MSDANELAQLRRTVDQHSLILSGDGTKYPPIDGVLQILQKLSAQVSHPENGNEALRRQVDNIKEQDKLRSAFLNGAKWLTVMLWTIGGVLGGMVIAYFTMLRTH